MLSAVSLPTLFPAFITSLKRSNTFSLWKSEEMSWVQYRYLELTSLARDYSPEVARQIVMHTASQAFPLKHLQLELGLYGVRSM